MCCTERAALLLIAVLALTPSHATAGIDEVHTKPEAARTWGELLADFVGHGAYQKSYALVVGISAYSGGYKSLPTQNDPIRMQDFLLNEAGFDYVHVITDENVTSARLTFLMEDDFPARIDENDRFLFYWSGHGTQRRLPGGGLSGYLALAASSRERFATMVSMDDIQRWDRNIAAKQTLYLVDACFSGLAGVRPKSNYRAITIEQLAQPSRHLLVAGTKDEQTIAGSHWSGSIFTDSVLKGLRGDADAASTYGQDGLVSLNELIDYVRKRVSIERHRVGWENTITPQLRDLGPNAGEFFFLTAAGKATRAEHWGQQPRRKSEDGMPVTMISDLRPLPTPMLRGTFKLVLQRGAWRGPQGAFDYECELNVHRGDTELLSAGFYTGSPRHDRDRCTIQAEVASKPGDILRVSVDLLSEFGRVPEVVRLPIRVPDSPTPESREYHHRSGSDRAHLWAGNVGFSLAEITAEWTTTRSTNHRSEEGCREPDPLFFKCILKD